jgi:hypothetical protein
MRAAGLLINEIRGGEKGQEGTWKIPQGRTRQGSIEPLLGMHEGFFFSTSFSRVLLGTPTTLLARRRSREDREAFGFPVAAARSAAWIFLFLLANESGIMGVAWSCSGVCLEL